MDALHSSPPATSDDLSALAWVQEELRRSLENAHKTLRRYVKESDALQNSDVDAIDPALLRGARQQFHQGIGALELVGLPAAATVLRASEAAVQRFVARPQKLTLATVEIIERASFALLEYLARLLSGKELSPVAMFPQYRAVLELAGTERIHPADLWEEEWRWRELPPDYTLTPRHADAKTRGDLESQVLSLMRNPLPITAEYVSDLFAALAAGTDDLHNATTWRLAAGMYEGQSQGLLKVDNYSKRIASRLLSQLRMIERGEPAGSERLAQDLLFFCAQCESPGDGRSVPRLAVVRQVFGLAHHLPVQYETSSLGKFDPAWIIQARKRVAAAKDTWSGVAGGEMHRLAGLSEQFALMADSVRRLYPSGDRLSSELIAAAAVTVEQQQAPAAPLAMEVATSVLYLEASLEDGELDHPQLGARIQRLAARIASVRGGQQPEALEAWMEELYRRVSDRQTMGSVVQELHASLADAEKHIDQYFREPSDRNVLITVPQQLASMRGVLSVLGMDQATAAVLRMHDEVDALLTTEVDQERSAYNAVFERLAGNLGALGFLIDMLSVQPQLAKSLFVFEADTGNLKPVMGRHKGATWTGNPLPGVTMPVEPRLIEQAQSLAVTAIRGDVPVDEVSRDLERLSHQAAVADQPGLAASVAAAQEALDHAADRVDENAAREQLALAMNDFVVSSSEPMGLDPDIGYGTAPASRHIAPEPAFADDDEMREIFLEEAREVLEGMQESLDALAQDSHDLGAMTNMRRAFHTLKGSGRMVGLNEFGEAAWACEQLYNARLADRTEADAPLLDFSREAHSYLNAWVEAIGSGSGERHEAAVVRSAADALRVHGEHIAFLAAVGPVALSEGSDVPAGFQPTGFPADLPSAAELDLSNAIGTPRTESIDDLSDLRFALDVEGLEGEASRPDAASTPAPIDLGLDGFGEGDDLLATMPLPLIDDDGLGESPLPSQGFELLDIDLNLDFGEPETPAAPTPEVAVTAASDESAVDLPEAIDEGGGEAPSIDIADLGETAAEAAAHAEPEGEAGHAASVSSDAETEAEAKADTETETDTATEAAPSAHAEEESALASQVDEGEPVRIVGSLRIGIPLFNIYLNEADELSRRLTTELGEWSLELDRPVGETAIALAHSLAGSSATVGFADLSQLSRVLEHALTRAQAIGNGTEDEAQLFNAAADEIRGLLHQFAAGFLKSPNAELMQRLADHEVSSARRMEALSAAADAPTSGAVEAADVEAAAPSIDFEAEAEAVPQHASDAPTADAPPTGFAEAAPSATTPMPTDTLFVGLGQTELKSLAPLPTDAVLHAAHAAADALDADDDIDAVDVVDAELFPIFEEEGEELLAQLHSRLRDWVRKPGDPGLASACMRTLHTLKGGARLAGAMRLGELAHRLETAIDHLLARGDVQAADVEPLQSRADTLVNAFEALRLTDAEAYEAAQASVVAPAPSELAPLLSLKPVSVTASAPVEAPPAPVDVDVNLEAPEIDFDLPAAEKPVVSIAPLPVASGWVAGDSKPAIDWSRFVPEAGAVAAPAKVAAQVNQSAVRVRAPLLDRLVNQAGEVSITRARIESEVSTLKTALVDLTDNLQRLREQLREIELQAETQLASRMEAAKAASETFDPLESDRFTRFQELTRMMAESVNDVATVQRTLQRTLESTEDELAAQARLTRDLQDDLLRTRMVEFESLSDRLYRVVRLASKETGKQVRLDIIGGSIEVDRGVLDRMTGAFEHLLRNSVAHGVELPEVRTAAGKDPVGTIIVAVHQEGNEIGVEFRDDGQGLDLQRIRKKGVTMGWLEPDDEHTDAELANLIFTPGFSTVDTITELAGRGIGMDVVRSDVIAMGGRVETATDRGHGTSFKLMLPLTTAVTQVVMLRCGDLTVAVPSTLVEIVRRATADEIERAYETGAYTLNDQALPFFWLGALLQLGGRGHSAGRMLPVVVIRSAKQRIVMHVDEVLGNQEVVVKNLGPQMSRMPGLAGMTLLASGLPALIYNPVALATIYGQEARNATVAAMDLGQPLAAAPKIDSALVAPLVLVVDDSLTVRRVTQRLLVREGYRVTLAKDGLDALERLAEAKPDVVLSDIEMPRMDGFDLVRNLRGDARWRDLPVIMITSRIAQKHRDLAAELGVDHYLGKPYAEEDLLALIRRYLEAEALS